MGPTMSSVGAPQSPALPKGVKAPAVWHSAAQPQGSASRGCQQRRQDCQESAPERAQLGRARSPALFSRPACPQSCRRPGIRGQGPPDCQLTHVSHPILHRERRPLGRRSDREHSGAAGPQAGGRPGLGASMLRPLPRSCPAPSPSDRPPAGTGTAASGTLRGIYHAVQSFSRTAASGPGPPSLEDGCPPRSSGCPLLGRRPRDLAQQGNGTALFD